MFANTLAARRHCDSLICLDTTTSWPGCQSNASSLGGLLLVSGAIHGLRNLHGAGVLARSYRANVVVSVNRWPDDMDSPCTSRLRDSGQMMMQRMQ